MIITFDCYGTLIDWEGGIADAFESEAIRQGHPYSRQRVIEAWHFEEPHVQAESFRPYREVLALTAERVLGRMGWECHSGCGEFLVESFGDWSPFADTNGALEALAARDWMLGILSNVDDDLLALTRRHFTVDFDLVVTAEQVRSYKPALAHFVEARRRIGEDRWLHAAQSWFHDIVPCVREEIPVAWINRKGEPARGTERPDLEVDDLRELVDRIEIPVAG